MEFTIYEKRLKEKEKYPSEDVGGCWFQTDIIFNFYWEIQTVSVYF